MVARSLHNLYSKYIAKRHWATEHIRCCDALHWYSLCYLFLQDWWVSVSCWWQCRDGGYDPHALWTMWHSSHWSWSGITNAPAPTYISWEVVMISHHIVSCRDTEYSILAPQHLRACGAGDRATIRRRGSVWPAWKASREPRAAALRDQQTMSERYSIY